MKGKEVAILTHTQHEVLAPSERWIQLRSRAGFATNLALERALDIAPGGIWNWIARERDPVLTTLRRLKSLLSVSLDELDDLLLALRAEYKTNSTA